MGPTGPTGPSPEAVYAGMFNNTSGRFDLQDAEVDALQFSSVMPSAGMAYDELHSIVTQTAGIYEIYYQLRGIGLAQGKVQVAVTADGSPIPGTVLVQPLAPQADFAAAGSILTALGADTHLHLIIYANGAAKMQYQEGVNATLRVRRLGDAPITREAALDVDSAD